MSYSALSRLRAFADAILADGKKRGRELVVGTISNDVVMDLQQKGVTLETTDVIIDDAVIVKYPCLCKKEGYKGCYSSELQKQW
jgi:hypothetical protein